MRPVQKPCPSFRTNRENRQNFSRPTKCGALAMRYARCGAGGFQFLDYNIVYYIIVYDSIRKYNIL